MIASVHLIAFSTLTNPCLVSLFPVYDKDSHFLSRLSFSQRPEGLAAVQRATVGITGQAAVLIFHTLLAVQILNMAFNMNILSAVFNVNV